MLRKFKLLVYLLLCILLLPFAPAAASSAEQVGGVDVPLTSTLEIIGSWQGENTLGNILVTITAENMITISHPGCDLLDEVGTFTADVSTIYVTFDEGASQIYRYLITGDTMLLADESL